MTTVDDPMPLQDALRILRNVSEHNTRDIPSPGQVAEAVGVSITEAASKYKAALEEIVRVPYFYEETAWTWSDISKKQTDIARAALGLGNTPEKGLK